VLPVLFRTSTPSTVSHNLIFQVATDITTTTSSDPLDPIISEVPEHLRDLFQTTINNLSLSLASGLKDLFVEHKETFATGPTDIGYCDFSSTTLIRETISL